jgi:hypothetical protein
MPQPAPPPTPPRTQKTSPTGAPIRCTATTAAGRPCRAWAVRGSDPPRCSAHRGGQRPVGAPAGNTNALKHGAYASPPDTGLSHDSEAGSAADLAARIADLNRRADQLAAYLDRLTIGDGTEGTTTVQDYAKLVALQGQLCSRIGRLMRDLQQLQPDDQDFLQECINEALDQASVILGVQL